MRRNLPAQQPRLPDAVRIQVGDEVGIIAAVPENVLVRINS
jgi:hypothetical protein